MRRHRSHSVEFKRQVAQEFMGGETLHGLAKRHDLSRNLIRIWVEKYEAGALGDNARAADLILNQQSLPEALAPWQIGYEHIAELGGLRGRSRGAEPSPNTYWRVRSFQHYADYALTAPFAAGLARLRERGSQQRCVIAMMPITASP